MALTDYQGAWVNNSSSIIPVYDSVGDFGMGHTTAGGTQIGKIYPGEFYTTRYNGSYATYREIKFRNSKGYETTGYIETLPQGYTHPEASWVPYQEPYHYYNSNGYSLVESANMGTEYRIFTVKKSVIYRAPNGTYLGTLPVGTRLLTNTSQTGDTFAGYMLFNKMNTTGGVHYSSWVSLTDQGYGFVDLGLSKGSEPATRAIW